MFEKYSHKTKFTALLIVAVMLAIAAYKRSFGPLLNLIVENRQLSEEINALEDSSGKFAALQAEVAAIDGIIGNGRADKEKVQQEIVRFVAGFEAPVSIYDVQPIHRYDDENYVIYTNQIDVTGGVNDLLALAYAFETRFALSRLANVRFYTTRKNNAPDILHLKLIFQNYENKI